MRSSLVGIALILAAVRPAGGQAIIPGQMHRSFVFELHSVKDEVLLYEGDPQYLMHLVVQPRNTLIPRIDFTNVGQSVVLRLHDLSLLEPSEIDSMQAAENAELGIDDEASRPPPAKQVWELQLAPASPGEYILRCDGGKASFDFTDLPAREIHILADTTQVLAEFKRPNPVILERFKLTVRGGSLDLRSFRNARPKTASLQVDGSTCDIDLTGKPFEGVAEVFFEGIPKRMRLVVPRDAGVHVAGPSIVVARFDRAGMQLAGTALESAEYGDRPCKLRLYFSHPFSKLDVEWDD